MLQILTASHASNAFCLFAPRRWENQYSTNFSVFFYVLDTNVRPVQEFEISTHDYTLATLTEDPKHFVYTSGEGRKPPAACKDDGGQVHEFSAHCPHLKRCVLELGGEELGLPCVW